MAQSHGRQARPGKKAPGKAPAGKTNSWLRPAGAAAIIVVVAITAVLALRDGGDAGPGDVDAGAAAVAVDADLVIPVSEISTTARFYPVEIEGTRLEVIAVEAPDGTIRTAFNTCQVCYDSGRGYYKQDGDVLVCQNCGNRFRMDQVEVESGGCNPVPIFDANKAVTDSEITIAKAFFEESKAIFANWKSEY
ncbi:MAG: DUF2318 domain-containing protein [Clostridiales Family XIII bacterium]|jgi:uncharacterized membrane protein|nr:DUF2318 domain-containing protein [Clostridiales Family XIII bacterium]